MVGNVCGAARHGARSAAFGGRCCCYRCCCYRCIASGAAATADLAHPPPPPKHTHANTQACPHIEPRSSSSSSVVAAAAASEQQQQQQHKSSASAAAAAGSEDMSQTLTLANIRSSLIRQEDTIIFQLIERAQYARNAPVYASEGVPVPGFDAATGRRYSLLEYVLRETEALHGRVRRYTSPTEHAFFPEDVPPLVLPPMRYPPVLAPCADAINVNDRVMRAYLDDILPAIARDGDDGNYGSAATLDVLVLQALSTRVHYGKFVAEAKFRARPDDYAPLIRARDAEGLMRLLTDEVQERRVVERVRLKAATFGQDIEAPPAVSGGSGGVAAAAAAAAAVAAAAAAAAAAADGSGGSGSAGADGGGGAPRFKVPYDALATIYDAIVMPLTKDVQVEYLLARLDGEQ